MKKINQIMLAGTISVLAACSANAQTRVHAGQINDNSVNELEIMNKLASPSVASVMPVSQLLNAPGNEALRAFFFTPVKDTSLLKGRRIAVLAADGFEDTDARS